MPRGKLFVLSGPSGAGKGTLVARLCDRIPHCWVSVSATTREPREGEIDGVHYFFLSDEQFDELVASDGLLESATVHAKRYGTPRHSVEEHLDAGEHVVLEIDVQGGLQVKQKAPGAHLIFIEPPSMIALRDRLVGRGTEDDAAIDRRMKAAEVELSQKKEYDYTLVNDDLEKATDELAAYVVSIIEGRE